MSKLFFLYFLLVYSTSAICQVSQTDKFEEEILNQYNPERVIPLQYDGLLSIGRYANSKQNSNLWAFSMMDTALSETWKKYFNINTRYQLQDYDTLGENIYLLLGNNHDVRQSLIIDIHILTGSFKVIALKNILPIYVTEFLVIDGGNKILLGGYFNARPLVIQFNIEKNTAVMLPGFFNLPGSLFQLSKNEKTGVIEVVIRNRINDKAQGLWLKTYSYDGDIIHDIQLPFNRGQIITQGKSVFTDNYIFVSSGTYSNKSTTYNNGLYFIAPTIEEEPKPVYVNFADLNNFFSFMGPRHRKRVAERIEKRKLLNKKNNFSYRVLLHSLKESDEGFILFAELYSRSSSNTASFSRSIMIQTYRTGLEFYNYISGFIICFDKKGNIIWDQAMKIDNFKSYYLTQKTSYHVDNNKGILLYPDFDKIQYKIFGTDNKVVQQSEMSIQPKQPSDKIIWRSNSKINVLNWYDNKFVAFGTHHVINKYDRLGTTRRKVFYINKIDYSLPMTSN